MEKNLKEDLSELMSHTIVSKLIKIADKYNYNRDNVVSYAACVLTAMCEFGTFKDFKELEQEPKSGHWIKIDTNQYTCDCCHTCFTIDLDDNNITQFSYCPNCGTKMQ